MELRKYRKKIKAILAKLSVKCECIKGPTNFPKQKSNCAEKGTILSEKFLVPKTPLGVSGSRNYRLYMIRTAPLSERCTTCLLVPTPDPQKGPGSSCQATLS